MWRGTIVAGLTVAVLLGAAWVGEAISQEGPGGEPRRERDPEQMRQRMEQFRQQMSERMRESMGATKEEWEVLQPKIEKVTALQRQSRGGMMRGGPGGRDRRPGGRDRTPAAGQEAERQQTEVEKASEGIQKVLEDKEAKPEQIKAALTALRDARAKAKAELETAQKELRGVVTLRQEATLVTMGMLD